MVLALSYTINLKIRNHNEKNKEAVEEVQVEEAASEDKPLELAQIRNICELSTVECYFNNIAKSVKEPGTGLKHLGEVERKFWIKYQIKVRVSYDISQIEMSQNDDEISIYLPEPKVTSSVIESSWNKDSYVISKDKKIQKNPITAEDQTKAIRESCESVEEEVRNNTALISTEQQQARTLIENYIKQMGKINNTEYKITWVGTEKNISSEIE